MTALKQPWFFCRFIALNLEDLYFSLTIYAKSAEPFSEGKPKML